MTITNATWDAATQAVQVNGFVSGVDEDGGTCTLTLTHGGNQVSVSGAASPDATTTNCGLLQTNQHLGPGEWAAVLSYRSKTSTGRSGPSTVTVP